MKRIPKPFLCHFLVVLFILLACSGCVTLCSECNDTLETCLSTARTYGTSCVKSCPDVSATEFDATVCLDDCYKREQDSINMCTFRRLNCERDCV